MLCAEARELFSPLLDGELPAGQTEALGAHLEVCSLCRQELAAWRAASQALRELRGEKQAPPELFFAVRARLLEVESARKARRVPVWKAWAAAAAAFLLLAGGTLFFTRQGGEPLPGSGLVAENSGEIVLPPEVTGAKYPPAPEEVPLPPGEEQKGKEVGVKEQPAAKEPSPPPPPAQEGPRVAASETKVSFLGQGGTRVSTLLEVAVADPAQALHLVVAEAEKEGAQCRVLHAGEEEAVLYCVVPCAQAEAFKEKVGEAGVIRGRVTKKEDLTAELNRLLQLYQEYEAEERVAQGEKKEIASAQLSSLASYIEKLKAETLEAGKEVVTVVLKRG